MLAEIESTLTKIYLTLVVLTSKVVGVDKLLRAVILLVVF